MSQHDPVIIQDNQDSIDRIIDQIPSTELLCSKTDKYKVIRHLGRGSFGQVIKCSQVGQITEEMVAIKILRDSALYRNIINKEIKMVMRLKDEECHKFNIIRALDIFDHNNHKFIVFEMLDQTLRQFMQKNKSPLKLRHIKRIVQQALVALDKLKQMGIIHADLKPENIMLVDHIREPFRIKVIDFGNAIHLNENKTPSIVQSLHYRAPEVLLGFSCKVPIDMWSLGCITAELVLGRSLYLGCSEYDQIRFICATQGLPSMYMLNHAKDTKYFFSYVASRYPYWRLKTPEEYRMETNITATELGKCRLKNLAEIGEVNFPSTLNENELVMEKADRRKFIDLLKQMLEIDPTNRIVPSHALKHSFFNVALASDNCKKNENYGCSIS